MSEVEIGGIYYELDLSRPLGRCPVPECTGTRYAVKGSSGREGTTFFSGCDTCGFSMTQPVFETTGERA